MIMNMVSGDYSGGGGGESFTVHGLTRSYKYPNANITAGDFVSLPTKTSSSDEAGSTDHVVAMTSASSHGNWMTCCSLGNDTVLIVEQNPDTTVNSAYAMVKKYEYDGTDYWVTDIHEQVLDLGIETLYSYQIEKLDSDDSQITRVAIGGANATTIGIGVFDISSDGVLTLVKSFSFDSAIPQHYAMIGYDLEGFVLAYTDGGQSYQFGVRVVPLSGNLGTFLQLSSGTYTGVIGPVGKGSNHTCVRFDRTHFLILYMSGTENQSRYLGVFVLKRSGTTLSIVDGSTGGLINQIQNTFPSNSNGGCSAAAISDTQAVIVYKQYSGYQIGYVITLNAAKTSWTTAGPVTIAQLTQFRWGTLLKADTNRVCCVSADTTRVRSVFLDIVNKTITPVYMKENTGIKGYYASPILLDRNWVLTLAQDSTNGVIYALERNMVRQVLKSSAGNGVAKTSPAEISIEVYIPDAPIRQW